MFEDLREIVEIKSVDAPASRADAPFGQGLRNALDWFLNKASSYGLKVGEGDGYYGYADYGDPDAPILGVLCHLDVVPAPDEAFIFREDENAVYGRGVADDKGAIAMMLDIMREFREKRVPAESPSPTYCRMQRREKFGLYKALPHRTGNSDNLARSRQRFSRRLQRKKHTPHRADFYRGRCFCEKRAVTHGGRQV